MKDNGASVQRGYVFGGEAAVPKKAYDACVAATKSAASKLTAQID